MLGKLEHTVFRLVHLYILCNIFCAIRRKCTKAIDKYNLMRHNMYRL